VIVSVLHNAKDALFSVKERGSLLESDEAWSRGVDMGVFRRIAFVLCAEALALVILLWDSRGEDYDY